MTASVVIGNYNYARFLGEAIDSVLAQTLAPVEIIVVDDGSTDDSRDVIAGYGERVTPVFKGNGGMASTYNAGVPRSRGDVIVFLDADDRLLPNAIERVVPVFTLQIAKVHWPLLEIDTNGRLTGNTVPATALPHGDFREAVLTAGPDAYRSPPTSGNAWSRAFIEEVLPVPEEDFRQHADVYLTTLAPLFGPVAAIPEPLAHYRVHGANDYAGKAADEKLRRNLEVYARRCRALAWYAERRTGTVFDPATWMATGTPYDGMRRLKTAMDRVTEIVPAGVTYILVDDQQWGERTGASEIIGGRRSVPFLERDGQYFGPPPDDETAIRELERLRESGATHAVFGWQCFWWLDYYTAFRAWLESRFAAVERTGDVVVFDLRR